MPDALHPTFAALVSGPPSGTSTPSAPSSISSAASSSADLHSLAGISPSPNTLGLKLGTFRGVNPAPGPASTEAPASTIPIGITCPSKALNPAAQPAPASAASPPTLALPIPRAGASAGVGSAHVAGYITPERVSKPLGSTGALWGNVAWERAFASPPRRG